MLKETFATLLENYTADDLRKDKLWAEISGAYGASKRHYHTLAHLEHLLTQLTDLKQHIRNWDAVLFSLFYHDAIYDVLKSNNEQRSADLAKKRMTQLFVGIDTIAWTEKIILATASHSKATDNDVNIFTDADLSILGQPWEVYELYARNVRKEYSIYPDAIYNHGRKKVLKHFLAMDSIFKTEYFAGRYEDRARQNLQRELDLLQ